MSTNHMKFGR